MAEFKRLWVVGLTLEQESVITGISKTGCFIRHKLHNVLRNYRNSQKMESVCEVDGVYTSINLGMGSKENAKDQ